MDGPCQGRVALVTGASRGIGAHIAQRLARAGATVVLTARTLEPSEQYPGSLRETEDAIRAAGGRAVSVAADLSQGEDRQRLVEQAREAAGPIDILVNNAAVTFFKRAADFPARRYRLMFELQVHAPFELAQLTLPDMRERGAGWILNVTSRAANHPAGPPFDTVYTGTTVYGMCKAALERFTTGLALEVHDDGVAVNALAPWDVVATHGAVAHDLADFDTEPPELVAEAALALCTGDPAERTGRVAYSRHLVAELGLQPRAPGGVAEGSA